MLIPAFFGALLGPVTSPRSAGKLLSKVRALQLIVVSILCAGVWEVWTLMPLKMSM